MIQVAGTGGEPISFHSQLLKDRDVKIAERPTIPAVPFKTVMLTTLEPATGQHDGQVATGVGTGITHPTTKHHHRGVQQRTPFSILDCLESVQKPRELLCIIQLNDGQLPQQIRAFPMVTQGVISQSNPLEGE